MDNLTLIIPFRDGNNTIDRLLDSVPSNLPVIVVDDLSNIPYQTNRVNVQVIRSSVRGYFSGTVNTGIKAAKTDVLILNQDVWLEDFNWNDLDEQRKTFAMIGNAIEGKHPAWANGYIDGIFMFLRRDLIDALGTVLDETDYPLWGSTCLAQLRACRLGFQALPLRIPGLHHERQGDYGTAIMQTLKDEPEKARLFIRTPPGISVIITCHNYGRFLPEAIHSLIGGKTCLGDMPPQTFQSFEIIIIDDASTDETQVIGESLADAWKGIRYYRTEANVGSAKAMNIGIEHAYGKVIAPLDADDMMEFDRLGTLYRVLQGNPHSVIYDECQVVYKEKRQQIYRLPEYDFELVLNKNPMHKGIVYTKDAWKESGGYPEVMRFGREDWAFNIALGIKGYCGIRVPKPLYLYRRHAHNRTSQQDEDMVRGTTNWKRVFETQLRQLYPKIYQGDRPMACCGGGKAKVSAQVAGRVQGAFNVAQIGANGMVLLEYLGAKASMPYYGTVTHTRYLFGGQRKTGYVDARDVEAFLKPPYYTGGNPMFRVAQEIQVQSIKSEPKPEIKVTVNPEPVAPGFSDVTEVDAAGHERIVSSDKPNWGTEPTTPAAFPEPVVEVVEKPKRGRKSAGTESTESAVS